jgi:hypothetical protein
VLSDLLLAAAGYFGATMTLVKAEIAEACTGMNSLRYGA